MKKTSLFDAIFLFGVVFSQANASTFWVDDDSPSGNGTRATPFSTINVAVTSASPYDTVHVLPGTYEENLVIDIPLSLIGSGASVTSIISANSTLTFNDDCEIRGFTIESGCVYCSSGVARISENVIQFKGTLGGWGIFVQCDSSFIDKNFVTGFETPIFVHAPFAPYNGFCEIRNNILFSLNNFRGIWIESRIDGAIFNNSLYFGGINSFYAIKKEPDYPADVPYQFTIENNIVVVTNGVGIEAIDNSQNYLDLPIMYNDVFIKNEGGIPFFCKEGPGNISEDPLFENPDGLDFRPKEGSPCTDAGNPDPRYNDLDGSRNDMGALGGPDPFDIALVQAPTISISLADVAAFPGDTIQIPISLSNASTLVKATFSIEFDPDLLELISVEKTSLSSNFSLQTDLDDSGGFLQIGMQSVEGIFQGAGEFLILVFHLPDEAIPESATSIVIQNPNLKNKENESFNIDKIVHGAVSVIPPAYKDHYIHVNGNVTQNGDGRYDHPHKTIQEAMATAVAGDTVFVAGGEYFGQIDMKEGVYLLGASPLSTTVTISENDRESDAVVSFVNVSECGIEGFTLSLASSALVIIDCHYASPVIRGNRFVLDIGSDETGVACFGESDPVIVGNYFTTGDCITNATGIWAFYGTNVLIDGNTFELTNGLMPRAFGGDQGTYCLFKNNEVHVVSEGSILAMTNSNGVFQNNRISAELPNGSLGDFARLFSGSEMKELVMENNVFFVSEEQIGGILIESCEHFEAINNTLTGTNYGMDVHSDSSIILNNIITDCAGTGLRVAGESSVLYNDFWQCEPAYEECTPGEGNLSADPLFLEGSYYQLDALSPCIDQGHPAAEYNDPDGTRNDMGAYGGPNAPSVNGTVPTTLSMPSTNGYVGDTLLFPVLITSPQNLAQAELNISYPASELEILNAYPTGLGDGFRLSKQNSEGQIHLSLQRDRGGITGSGQLVNLQIRLAGASKPDSSVILSFQTSRLADRLSRTIPTVFTGGKIQIKKSGINRSGDAAPTSFYLAQNFPNPFNSNTLINFGLDRQSRVTLKIFDITGRQVKTLIQQTVEAGHHKVLWDGTSEKERAVSSGIYFAVLQAGKRVQTRKLILLR